jgi:hypothetical protein
MSSEQRLRAPRTRATVPFRPRSPQRARPDCETLEPRQLLALVSSVAPIGEIVASPAQSATAEFASGPTGLTPEQIRSAYGINAVLFSGGTITGNGAGQTIAIVDAYKDPSIAADLAAFDAQYGLQAPPSLSIDNLGATTTNAGWDLETSLDVEWAHAIAPAANIILVEAVSSSLASLFNAVGFAARQAGVDVVSMSWGTQEFRGESAYDSLFTTPAGHNNVTFVAASGDNGAWYGPDYPSVSPNVLAVGGTTLSLSSGGAYSAESGWSGSTGGFSGLDSNFRSYEPEPSYQTSTLQSAGLSFGVRTTPDVSFNADPSSGVSVYDSTPYDGQSGWFQLGGTSAAAPAWAGLVAITDQGLAAGGKGPLGTTELLADLYSLPSADFNDITSGSNGYSATSGYDLVTGLGSPKANLLVAGLLAASGVSEGALSPAITGAAATTTASSAPTSASHHHARHVHHAKVHRAEATSAPTNQPSSSGSSTGAGSSSSSTTSSTAAHGLAGGGSNSATAAGVVFSSLVAPDSAIPLGSARGVATSSSDPSANSATQSSSPAGTLGQDVQRAAIFRWEEVQDSAPTALAAEMAKGQPRATGSEEMPALGPLATPGGDPVDDHDRPAPLFDDPGPDTFDLALEQVAAVMPARGSGAILRSKENARTRAPGPLPSIAAPLGTAILAAGGYGYVLQKVNDGSRRTSPAARFDRR